MKKIRIKGRGEPSVWNKCFRIMKLTTLFFLIGLMQISASVYSQSTKLSLEIRNQKVIEVLEEIEKQSEFRFAYSSELIDLERKVSVELSERDIEETLNVIFDGTGVKHIVYDRHIMLYPKEMDSNTEIVSNQQKTITGTVTDDSGQSLPGVTVLIKGTTQGTVTNMDGNYSISNIPENSTLVFSFIGMRTQEILVGNKTTIDVQLEVDAVGIEEVIAVGYGVQRKVNMTGAVSMINFDEEVENRPITNASQALSGKIPGIWVSQNSGKPGSDGAQIRVRGWGTLNNSNPLVIIDGIEGDFDQLNPNDIESVSVLKDAASAAIYGSKAANGVILITTKTGKTNERMQVNLSSYYGVQVLGRRYNLINNSAEHMRMTNTALANEGGSPLFPDNMISAFENGTDKYKYPSTDWYDVAFENAPIQEHNLSIKGGTEKSSSFLSFNYLNQDGMIPNTNSERYGIRANLESRVNSWFTVDCRINYSHKVSEEAYNDIVYGSMGRFFDMLNGVTPYTAPYTRDGEFGAVEAITDDGNILFDNRNPLIDANNGKKTAEENFLSINASANVELFDFLNWRTTVASTGNWNLIDNYNQSIEGFTDSGIPMMTKNYNREGIEISRSQVSSLVNNVFSTLNFNKTVAEIHEFSAIAGLQVEDRQIKNVYARRSDPPKEGLTQVDAGTSGIQGEGNMVGLRMFSYFGRFNYALSGKYLFEANIRADASSRFKEGNRWGIFPGFSVGWRVIDESFMEDQDIFSNLKLRASWGQLGNQNIAGYWPYLTIINQDNNLSYSYADGFAPGAAVTSLIDENITWETTSTLDIGVDAGFMNNKITVEADYFQKKTTDIIVQLPIPDIMGDITPPYENVGEMVNNGFEFTINYDNQSLDRDRFGYNIGLNATYIDNEVTKFRGGDSPDQLYLIREGYSYRTLYGYKAVGIYQSDSEAAQHMSNNSYTPIAGNLKFEDVNNDGKLGFEDKQDIGNTIPKITYGLSTAFKYKGFDLNLLFQGLVGVHSFNSNALTTLNYENRTISTRWRDAWTPQNTDTDVPILYLNNSWDNLQSSYWVKEISFLKLKNVQLGYALPTDLTTRIGLQKIYFYVNAQNVFVLVDKDFEGYDPEKSAFSHGTNQYPVSRIISLGLNLNF
ncbi:MAG: TonB-dependent receptor [Prolixibacteraceae bacterium]|jgi:TonB-dependent starch-binding outer membrane protein SusC|nr:TonB-dependent receptor [Prolixibacteraceae bacterium]MBT6763071.1 TonB-dependent receptor [Prolixibacteraceae bacterium]MBT7000151.1 TonB-dependent receptor [Prolixibacteraceae bacterium]MBT7395641.1 TonB-dependent receptor [Prolixibacteraceae bacterium]